MKGMMVPCYLTYKLSHNLYFLANIPRNISKKVHYKKPPAASNFTGNRRFSHTYI